MIPSDDEKRMVLSTLKTGARRGRAGGAAPACGRGGQRPRERVEAAVRPKTDWTGNPAGVPRPGVHLSPPVRVGTNVFLGVYFSPTPSAWGTDLIRMRIGAEQSSVIQAGKIRRQVDVSEM